MCGVYNTVINSFNKIPVIYGIFMVAYLKLLAFFFVACTNNYDNGRVILVVGFVYANNVSLFVTPEMPRTWFELFLEISPSYYGLLILWCGTIDE
jgi:hypothetical protein